MHADTVTVSLSVDSRAVAPAVGEPWLSPRVRTSGPSSRTPGLAAYLPAARSLVMAVHRLSKAHDLAVALIALHPACQVVPARTRRLVSYRKFFFFFLAAVLRCVVVVMAAMVVVVVVVLRRQASVLRRDIYIWFVVGDGCGQCRRRRPEGGGCH